MKKKIIAAIILAGVLALGFSIEVGDVSVSNNEEDVKAVYVMMTEYDGAVVNKSNKHVTYSENRRPIRENVIYDRDKADPTNIETKVEEEEITVEDILNVNEVSYEMYSTTSLNVRAYPSTDGKKIGVLSLNEKVEVTGEVDNGWVRISYKDTTAYVNANYLSKEKVVVSTPNPAPVSTSSSSSSSEASTTTVVVGKEGTFDLSAGQAAVDIVNGIRAENGLGALTWDDALYDSAKIRAAEASIVWSHTRPDGTGWYTVSGVCQGENLAKGYATAQEAVDGWMSSQGHKDNILRADFTRTAVAFFCTENGWFWCEHFGY